MKNLFIFLKEENSKENFIKMIAKCNKREQTYKETKSTIIR